MSAVRTAIWNKFIADNNAPLYLDLDGTRLYYDEAEQNPTYPYCVFSNLDQDYDYEFTERFEYIMIQFDYFSQTQSPDECDDGVADIITMFDWTNLTVSGFLFLKMERDFIIPARKVQPENVWQGSVRYNLWLQDV